MAAILLSQGDILTMQSVQPEQPREGWLGIVGQHIALLTYDEAEAEAFRCEHSGDLREIDCRGRIIMPGLINTHTHVAMTSMRNMADDKELMEWLEDYIWPFEARQTVEHIKAGARLGIAEMLLSGTTSFVDMYFHQAHTADAVEELGARALLCECVFDMNAAQMDERVTALVERCENSALVTAGIGPHAPYTCSPDLLSKVRDYVKKYNLPLTIHLSESPTERSTIMERYGCSPAEYLLREGVLRSAILAHCIHLDDVDMRLLADAEALVSHDPQSNMKLASGVAPLCELLSRGVACSISTDGPSSNNDLNMWEELRTSLFLQRVVRGDAMALGAYDVLRLATAEAARAFGLYGRLGVLAVGAFADVVVVDMRSVHLRPRNNAHSALVFCAQASDVEYVIVDGVLRVAARQLLHQDIEKLCQAVEGATDPFVRGSQTLL